MQRVAAVPAYCVQRLSHGDLVVLEAIQRSKAYAVQLGDAGTNSPALLILSEAPVQEALGLSGCLLEVVDRGEWLGLRSPLLEGLFLQARKKSPHLAFVSPLLGVYEQWEADALFQGVLQHHSPALRLTSRQLPGVSLSVRAWKVASAPVQRALSPARPLPQPAPAQSCTPEKSLQGGEGNGYAASVSSSLQDDALELSHNVLKGYIVRVLKWPLYFSFRVWRAQARAVRRRRAEAAAHHERWLQSTAWAAMQQRAATERHERHMIVLACQCWAKQRANRLARALHEWHARARRTAVLERLRKVYRRKAARRRTAAVLVAWGRYAQEKRTRWLLYDNARSFLASQRARVAFLAWREAAVGQRVSVTTFQQHHRHGLLHSALQHWHSVASHLVGARQAALALISARTATTIFTILYAWRELCQRRRHLVLREKLVMTARARRSLTSIWCAWRDLTDDGVQRRRRVDLVLAIRGQQLVGCVLRRWAVLARQAAVLRFAADQMVARLERRMLPRVFAAWREVTLPAATLPDEEGSKEATRLLGILRRRLANDRRSATARSVLLAWRELAVTYQPLVAAAAALSRAKTRGWAHAVLLAWRAWVQSYKDSLLHFRNQRQRVLLRDTCRAWASLVARSRQLIAIGTLVLRRSLRFHLRVAFGSWLHYTRRMRELHARAVGAHTQGLIRRALGTWRRRCACTRRAVAALARCRQAYERQLVADALHAMRLRTARERRVRICCERRARELVQRVLRCWREWTIVAARRRSFGSLLQSKWQCCLARAVLRSWFLASQAAALQLHLLEAMRGASTGSRTSTASAAATAVSVAQSLTATMGPSLRVSMRRGPSAQPQLHPPQSAASVPESPLLRILSAALGGASTAGGRGGAAATQSLVELLQALLPTVARLAARPRQHLLAVLKAWRAATTNGCRLRLTAARLLSRRRSLVLASCFRAWRATVWDIRARRSAAMTLASRAVRNLAVDCLAAWRVQARQTARLRRACLMLLARRTARLQSGVLAAWRGEVRAAQARQLEVRKLKGDARLSLLERALQAWQLALVAAAEVQATAEKRHAATQGRLKRQVLTSWRQVTAQQEQHLSTCTRLLRARAERRLLALVLGWWSSFSQQERQRRENWPHLCRVFYAWRTLVQPAGRVAAAAEARMAELGLDAACPGRAPQSEAGTQTHSSPPVAAPSNGGSGSPPDGSVHARQEQPAGRPDSARPPSPPPEELRAPDHVHGMDASAGLGVYGQLAAQVIPGGLSPSSAMWHQWYNMMHASGMGGLQGGPLPLAPGGWGVAHSAAAPSPNGEEADALRERVAKLEGVLKQQGQDGVSSPTAASTAAIRPPLAPVQGNSTKTLTASCRPEPGPVYQVRQQGSSPAIGRVSSSMGLTLPPTAAPDGSTAAHTAAPAQSVDKEKGSDKGVASTQAVAAALPPSPASAPESVSAPAGAPPPPAPVPALAPAYQGPPPALQPQLSPSSSWKLSASCRPELGPLCQVKAGNSAFGGRASQRSMEPTESVISEVACVIAEATTAALKAQAQAGNAETGPLYQIKQGGTIIVGRASTKPSDVLEPADSLPNSITSIHATQVAPSYQPLHVVIRPFAQPLPAAASHSGSDSTAAGSSSLGSPTSLQAWSRRTTADLSGASEAEPHSGEERRMADRVADGNPCNQPPEQAAVQSAEDVLLAAASNLLQRMYASTLPLSQQQQQEQSKGGVVDSQGVGGGRAPSHLPQSAEVAVRDANSNGVADCLQPAQQSEFGLGLGTTGDVAKAQQVALRAQEQGQALGAPGQPSAASSSLATMAPAGFILLPEAQVAQLLLPRHAQVLAQPRPQQDVLPQAQHPSSALEAYGALQFSTTCGSAQREAAATRASAQRGAGTQGMPVGPPASFISANSQATGGSSSQSVEAIACQLASSSAQTDLPLARQHSVATSVGGLPRDSHTPEERIAQHAAPALELRWSVESQAPTVWPALDEADRAQRLPNARSQGATALMPVASDPSDLELLLGELEAKSRSAMASPKRLLHSSSSDAEILRAMPVRPPAQWCQQLPHGALRRVTAATEDSFPTCGGPLPLGLQGLDWIDSLRVRATTLSAPGASIFTSTASATASGAGILGADLFHGEKAASFGNDSVTGAPATAACSEEPSSMGPVDAALRRLEAASMHARREAVVLSAAAAEAGMSLLEAHESRGLNCAAVAVNAAAATTTATATEQPTRPQPPRGAVRTGGLTALDSAHNPQTRHQSSAGLRSFPSGASAASLLETFLPGPASSRETAGGCQPTTRPAPSVNVGQNDNEQQCHQQLKAAGSAAAYGHDDEDQRSRGRAPMGCNQSSSSWSGQQLQRPQRRPGSTSVDGSLPPGRPGSQSGPSVVGDGQTEGSTEAEGMCPTCGSPVRSRRNPSPPPCGSPSDKQPIVGNSRCQNRGPEAQLQQLMSAAAEDRPLQCSDGGRAAWPGAPVRRVQWSGVAASNEDERRPLRSGGGSGYTSNASVGGEELGQQLHKDHCQPVAAPTQKQLQDMQQQQRQPFADPLAEVARLAQRRGNHHLAAMLVDLAGEVRRDKPSPYHMSAGNLGHQLDPPRNRSAPGAEPKRDVALSALPYNVSRSSGGAVAGTSFSHAPCSTHGGRSKESLFQSVAPASARASVHATRVTTGDQQQSEGPPRRAAAHLPLLQRTESVSSSTGSSSCANGSTTTSASSTVCEAVANGFDPDPLHSPLRRMLGECQRLQHTAVQLEEQGEAVAREVVAELSPRRAVAAALAAMLQQQGQHQAQHGPGVLAARVVGGRRVLGPADRRV